MNVTKRSRRQRSPRKRGFKWGLAVVTIIGTLTQPSAEAANGIILDQQLGADSKGYTVIRLWGSSYEMGHAYAELLGDHIVATVNQIKGLVTDDHYAYLRDVMAGAMWLPAEIEDEFSGMVDALRESHPEASIDELDLKVVNHCRRDNLGCRSHMCWGRYVEPPIRTLATRRFDLSTAFPALNHHVICARDPQDGSPRWVNVAFPGIVIVWTGLNQYGTLVAVHGYNNAKYDHIPGRISFNSALRYALTLARGPDLSTHITDVFSALRNYQFISGNFLLYYAPKGFGGVLTCHPYAPEGIDFYHLRRPHPAWHHGEALITTNRWTDGSVVPPDEDFGADAYYNVETAKTQSSHWDLLTKTTVNDWFRLQMLSVAYRGEENMTIWMDGRINDIKGIRRTRRLEYEWSDLFPHCPTLEVTPAAMELTLGQAELRASISAAANDPDGDPLTYTWTTEPAVSLEGEGSEIEVRFDSVGDYTILCAVTDGDHRVTAECVVKVVQGNRPPDLAVDPPGVEVERCTEALELTFTATATDPDGDTISYDWTVSPETALLPADNQATIILTALRECMVTCTASDGAEEVSVEVPVVVLACSARLRRGDCNDDGTVDISDAVCILSWLFLGGTAPGCLAVTNTNGDAGADLSDAVYLLSHLFLGGPAPVQPFPDCGRGTAEDYDEPGCETPPANCF